MTTSAAGGNSPASFTNRNRVTGLASGKGGFDTQGIVDSLMAIERRPYDDLDIKRQTEQLRLQAYQAINTTLLNFRNSVSTLSSKTLWNAKMTTSTNEKSLAATANEYAVKGSYSFKVAQVAAATEYASKVVADAKAPLSPPKQIPDPDNEGEMMDSPAEKIGEINLASAKTRVDNSAKLEQLNGGDGVFRGSIRVTDSNNGSANIDLSAAVTLDDVVRTINEASGVRINASIREGRLFIEDEAGGTSSLKIQNVGAGTTATDLGITGSSTDITNDDGSVTKALHGRNVYKLGNNMALSQLNDGMGVEEGTFAFRVYGEDSDGNDSYLELAINVDGAKTVGDVIKRVNEEIASAIEKNEKYPGGGGEPALLLKNLHFGISSDGTSFGFTGVTTGNTYQFYDRNDANMTGQMTPAQQLGLTNDIQEAGLVHEDPEDDSSPLVPAREVSFGRVLGDANSPMLKNLGGVDNLGVGTYPSDSRVNVPFNGDTKISALNGGEGLNTATGFNFLLLEGGMDADGIQISDDSTIINDAVDMVGFREWLKNNPDATVDDLLTKLNTEIQAYADDPDNNAAGLSGFTIAMDPEGGNRLVINGVQAGYTMQISGGLASSLGLTRIPMDGGDATIKLDPELAPELRDKLDAFYGMGDHKKPLVSGNDDILLEGDPEADPPEEATTLGDLDEMLNGGSVDDLFGSGGFTLKVGDLIDAGGNLMHDYDPLDPEYDADGVLVDEHFDARAAMEITVNWADLKDEEGNPLTLDEDTDAAALIDAMNRAIREQFAGTAQADGTTLYEGAVPQVRLNSMADGLQWSNMDFNSQYWEMEDAGGSSALESMNLAKDLESTKDLNVAHLSSRINSNLNPMETGYIDTMELNADTADEVLVGDLYYGAAINLDGADDDTFDITFKLNTAEEGGADNSKKVSFTLAEFKAALADKASALGKTDLKALTVDEYLGVMNDLVDNKIADYYMTEEPGVAADDQFSMDFAVGDNGTFIVDNLENAEGLLFGGNVVAGDRNGWNIGVKPYLYTAENLEDLADAGKPIIVNQMQAGKMFPQEIEGLGEIHFTLDGDESKIFKLDTKGIDQDSSLNDLLNHLNDQLKRMGSDDTYSQYNALLKDVRFVLNDSGTGIAVDNGSNARIGFIQSYQLRDDTAPDTPDNRIPDAQRLSKDLGLIGVNGEPNTVEAYSFSNGKSLGRNYISRATPLEEFVGKNVMDMGSIRITNAGGNTAPPLDLNGMKTLGDLIDAINAMKFGVAAQINARGDGIDIFEGYEVGMDPPADQRQGEIAVADSEGGVGLMKKLGLAGTGSRTDSGDGRSAIHGSLTKTIEVMSTDSMQDIMFRIAEFGYKTSVVNDGSGSYLSVSSGQTGEKYDFVIESDVEQLGFNQVKRGKDAKVLYGDPDSSGSPRMLSSESNSNANAINGITLDIKSASTEWTTITVEDDKEQVTEAFKAMTAAYNELATIIKALDAYDPETGEEGILFGDNNVRTMMDDINEFFYDVYNPNNVPLGTLDEDGKQQTWTWMDLGINLSAEPSNADGTGGWYNMIDLDEEALENMVATNWDVMSKMLSNEVNVANSNGSDTARPTGSFNGTLADGFSADGAINGDTGKTNFGKTNGIMGADTIENGDNAYTIWFQKSTRVNRMTINFPTKEDSLKDFIVEYLDSNTGEWKQLREAEGNMGDMVPYGFMTENIQADAIRLTASSTNSKDGKFRLSNIEIFEEMGLAGQMNHHTTELGDTQFGFLANMNDEIQTNLLDIEDQMLRLEETLTAKEEALWRRFTAMETAMSKLQGQGDYFTNMMNSLGGGK